MTRGARRSRRAPTSAATERLARSHIYAFWTNGRYGSGSPCRRYEVSPLGRLGRKRRDRNQPDQVPSFAVDSCEALVDGPFTLLRLTGTGVNPPASLIADGDKPATFAPLPGPDDA